VLWRDQAARDPQLANRRRGWGFELMRVNAHSGFIGPFDRAADPPKRATEATPYRWIVAVAPSAS
jgi:hypothetical protein